MTEKPLSQEGQAREAPARGRLSVGDAVSWIHEQPAESLSFPTADPLLKRLLTAWHLMDETRQHVVVRNAEQHAKVWPRTQRPFGIEPAPPPLDDQAQAEEASNNLVRVSEVILTSPDWRSSIAKARATLEAMTARIKALEEALHRAIEDIDERDDAWAWQKDIEAWKALLAEDSPESR